MATPQELLVFVFFGFSFLATMLYANPVVRSLVVFGLSYTCYIWSCEYLQDPYIYLTAARNARHLNQLSGTCANIVYLRVPEWQYSWYEQYQHCMGELWGLETWRIYRDYSSPHFLLLYIMVFLCIYHVVKYGGRWLKILLKNQPPCDDGAVFSDDFLAIPSACHDLFSPSSVLKVNSKLENAQNNSAVAELARLQQRLSDEQSARRIAEQQMRDLQKTMMGFVQERATYQEERISHQMEVEKLKQECVEFAHRQLRYNDDDEVRELE